MRSLKYISSVFLLLVFSAAAMAEVNINTASKDELMKGIDGLSSKQAESIIEYRDRTGAFVHLNELTFVGVGRDIIAPNYEKLTVGSATTGDKKNRGLN